MDEYFAGPVAERAKRRAHEVAEAITIAVGRRAREDRNGDRRGAVGRGDGCSNIGGWESGDDVRAVMRTIAGFHQDDEGDWVAELSCLHNQHVRHRPPFHQRPWVLSERGRAARIGSEIDCPLCDRAELPAGLHRVRTAGPFDADSLPAGLRTEHRVAPGTWGCLRVIEGSVHVSICTDPAVSVQLNAGDRQAIPPDVPHALGVHGPVRLAVDFLVRDRDGTRN